LSRELVLAVQEHIKSLETRHDQLEDELRVATAPPGAEDEAIADRTAVFGSADRFSVRFVLGNAQITGARLLFEKKWLSSTLGGLAWPLHLRTSVQLHPQQVIFIRPA
jgi:hypothetical protein